jgi:competence protein ComEC
VGVGRFALPLALAGVAGGILAADQGVDPPPAVIVVASVLCCALGSVLPRASRAGGSLLLIGVVLAAVAVGAWRQEATDPSRPSGQPSVAALVDGEERELAGTVVDDPRPRADRVQLVLDEVVVEIDGRPVPLGDRLLVWLPRGIGVDSGDRLRVKSEIELPEDFDGFAYREYLSRQGIGAIGRAREATVIAEAAGIGAFLSGLRAALLGGLNAVVPEPEAALGAGILLGVRASISPEINEAFATAGLTHVVAISGWNIAIIAALVAAMARPLDRRPGGRWSSATVAVLAVAGYVVLTGASPSVVRAALMAGCMLVARLGGSRAHAASALELAALIMVLVAPSVLWDVGFQLSLLATAGLIWFGAAVERRLPGWPGWIREPVALTLAAQVTTLPVILVNFERLSLVAPIANVLVVPFVPAAMLFSAIASLVGFMDAAVRAPLVGDVSMWFAGGCAWLVLRVIVALGTGVASLPYAAVDASLPAPFAVAWLPIVGLATWAMNSGRPEGEVRREAGSAEAGAHLVRRFVRPLPVGATLVAILLAVSLASRPDGALHVTVLDIGQGDSILVEAPDGTTMLVDGGPDPELALRRLGAHLPFFARRIDVVVLTHPHQDHVAGLVDVVDRFRVAALLEAGIPFENQAHHQLVADVASDPRLAVTLARAGQAFALDATTTVEVVYPTQADAVGPIPADDINNGSIVMILRHGGFTALLTGDAGAPVEALLLGRGMLPVVDLLKVGHHGSSSATTAGLLDAIRPTAAVISSGAGNDFGHPAPETLAALAARPEIAVHRTDLDGDVEIVTDGLSYRIRTDAGWSAPRPVHGHRPTGSIGLWPSPTDPPRGACSPTPACPTGSSSTPRAWPASQWPPPGWWRRPRSQSTARSSRRRRCSTTSTRSRSGDPAASTGSSARGGSRRRATPSSQCRSPPIRSAACSTTTDSRSAGPRSSWPCPTGTWPASS